MSYDRAKWNALVQYDNDITQVAERLTPLGQRWVDEFAASFLALNDKQYIHDIEGRIVSKANDEENSSNKNVFVKKPND